MKLSLIRGELSALSLDHIRRRLGDEALVAELALEALDLPAQAVALALDPRTGLLGVDLVRGEDVELADPSERLSPALSAEVQARQAGDQLWRLGARAGAEHRGRRDPHQVAPASDGADRGDRRRHLRLRGRIVGP